MIAENIPGQPFTTEGADKHLYNMNNTDDNKKNTTQTINYELNEANALRLGIDCQPKNKKPASVKCTRNEPVKWIAKLVEIIIGEQEYNVSNAAAVKYYCDITGKEVPDKVNEIIRENNLEPLGARPPDYIASLTGLFPSIAKAERFIAFYDKMTGKNIQQQLDEINSYLPSFFDNEEKEMMRKKASKRGHEKTSTKPKVTRGRNTLAKRNNNKVNPDIRHNNHPATHNMIKNNNRCVYAPQTSTRPDGHQLPQVGIHPIQQLISRPNNNMLPLGVNMPINGEQIGPTFNGMSIGLPVGHITQTASQSQMHQLPGFHGVPHVAYHNAANNLAATSNQDIQQSTQPNGGGYYTTFYYTG